ncbi:MAG TPA: hypothetical protein VHP33_02390 [Polyangiaceae bacterium]|nr:hypothetical protein [Polyangiaceae bacterium]
MSKAASQKNRQSNVAKMPVPQPLPDLDAAGTEDHEYALVSVLYHALQGAQACEQYVNDAERGDDPELVRFFLDCIQEQQQRAARAKQLLAGRIETDDVELSDDDSGA